MKTFPLLCVVLAVFLAGCACRSPEEHLAEAGYCSGYAQEETARAYGAASSYQQSGTYRVLYDTCMHKRVGERYFD